MPRWVWKSEKGDGKHAFLGDFDKKPRHLEKGEFLLPSRSKGHYHVIRPHAELTHEQYLQELIKRSLDGCDIMQPMILDINGYTTLTNHHNSHIALELQRYQLGDFDK